MLDSASRPDLRGALTELYRHLPPGRKRQFHWTLLLLICGGVAELATVAAMYLFLALFIPRTGDTRAAPLLEALSALAERLDLSVVITAAALLVCIVVGSSTLRLLLTWQMYKFVFGSAHDLGVKLVSRVLHQPYSYHLMRNSSETLAGLEKVQHVLANVLVPLILGFTAAILAVFVFAALVLVSPAIALSGSAVFALLYGGVTVFTKRRLEINSIVIATAFRRRVQTVQEAIGGIRDVILDRSQRVFLGSFQHVERQFRRAQTVNYFIAAAPRFVIEAGIIIMIALLGLYFHGLAGGIVGAIPVLGAIAIGAQRLLPLVQQVYSSWSQVSASRAVVADVAAILAVPVTPEFDDAEAMAFDVSITLENVSYRYPATDEPALKDVSVTIPKGSKLGLIGKSGSGKSTLADLLMGLIDPTAGKILIDGVPLDPRSQVAWRKRVAHVPQAIYLADSTIAANIAFGRKPNEIDMERVRRAARDADIDEFILGLPTGYETEVGERGMRLSGGQRQRLGIARALYKGAEVLILDEATSALDDSTESAVMDSIRRVSSHLTVILIAHRLTTLRHCDEIIEFQAGRIGARGSYQEVVKSSAA